MKQLQYLHTYLQKGSNFLNTTRIYEISTESNYETEEK